MSRTLHVYCSTSLCILLIFFSVTGITLNHQWSLSADESADSDSRIIDGGLISEWVNQPENEDDVWTPNIGLINRYLSEQYDLPVPKTIEIEQDLNEVVFEYRVPAGYASAILNVESRELIVETEAGSMLAVMNDLHKGRHSGWVWSWLIDISAAIMILFSVTGLIIVYQGRKYKRNGSLSIALGLLLPSLLYLFLFHLCEKI
ncbi:MAG: PepSY-associated TM helix domain-containing protein [Arenicella sp.]|nr:PepSY-associated TM helix domain-containing protein [Arenicella sp.]